MAVQLNKADMEELLEEIRSHFPNSLKEYGIIKADLEGRWTGNLVWVDKWPQFTTLIIQPDPYNLKADMIKYYVDVFSNDDTSLAIMLEDPRIIDWKRTQIIRVVGKAHAAVLKAMENQKGKVMCEECHRYQVQENDILQISVPDECRLCSVSSSMIPAVVDSWEPSIDSTAEYVRACIDAFPSSALFAPDGQLVSFAIQKYSGAVGLMYVHPDYRLRGYGSVVFADICRKFLNAGYPAYSRVLLGNAASRTFHSKMGSKEIINHHHYWLEFIPTDVGEQKTCKYG